VTNIDPDASGRTTILVHYYRAMVGRADVWRMRMDATTHWAIAATAAIVSFTLSDATVPHYVVGIAPLMTASLLLLEARRLTFYHLFQQRVLLLEEGLVRRALEGGDPAPELDLSTALTTHLGRTVPTMPIAKAMARRLRRVYLYLFGVQLLAWLLKLGNHPSPAHRWATFAERADTGTLPGEIVLGLAAILSVGISIFALMRGGIDREAV